MSGEVFNTLLKYPPLHPTPEHMKKKHITEVARMLKAIAHPIRLSILCSLREGEQTVSTLAEQSDTSCANLSQHLSILREHGLIRARKEANYQYNSIDDQRINQLILLLDTLYCTSEKQAEQQTPPADGRKT